MHRYNLMPRGAQVATGYGSPWLVRASACAGTLRHAGASTLAALALALLQLPLLIAFLWSIPSTRVNLSTAPSGRRIRAHLRLRRWGLPRFRLAQGVLLLPDDHTAYLRGRRRQAVRTNVARALARGVKCTHTIVGDWTPPDHRDGPVAPAHRWQAWSRRGTCVGEAWLTVDDRCALLHSLVTNEPDVRWLLHTAIVEDLCERGCRQLLTNSHDAFLMPAGQQYFQRLLGYSVAHIRPCSPRSPRWSLADHRLASASIILGSAAAMSERALANFL